LGLIHGILSDPEDDAPLLVYADWLDEQGDTLGEVIRVQVEMRHPLPRARREELGRRECELIDSLGFGQHGRTLQQIESEMANWSRKGWCFAITGGVPMLFPSPRWPGGQPPLEWLDRFGWFIVRIGTWDYYLHNYYLVEDTLRALLDSPLMENCVGLDLHSTRLPAGWSSMLVRHPVVSRLMRLDLNWCFIEAESLGELLGADLTNLVDLGLAGSRLREEHLTHFAEVAPPVHRLDLACIDLTADTVAALVNSPRLRQLRSLNLYGCRLDHQSALAMAEGTSLGQLAELNVRSNGGLGDPSLLALIRSPRLARLRQLNLSQTAAGAATVEALCAMDHFLRGGELNLSGIPNADEALAAVARSPHASLLRVLDAGSSGCTEAGAKALAASPHLENLLRLILWSCQIGPDGAEALAHPSALPNLAELWLLNNPIGDRGAVALARWRRRRGQKELNLNSVGLTASGVAQMVESGALASLTRLNLEKNAIGDEGVDLLGSCPDLVSLECLEIAGVGLTDAGARVLAGSPHLSPKLVLWVVGNGPGLSEAGVAVLRQRFARVGHDSDQER
jgi:uncharacterized protein (TIGR02996 family)